MKQLKIVFSIFILAGLMGMLSACEQEDPGPIQFTQKDYSLTDFDRLEMGSALHIDVEQANLFSIHVEGDRRNIDDLHVFKKGSTLIIRFDENANRRHDTHITITMPRLDAVNFSGASLSTVSGFESDGKLDFILSGGSVSQLDAGYREVNLVISGASNLVMHGLGDELYAEVSGASLLSAFDFPVREANVNVTGASQGKVTVSDDLDVVASGASAVLYRGNPAVSSTVSGSSSVIRE